MNVRSKNSNTRLGKRQWLTSAQMDKMFGEDVAKQMRERKETNEDLRATEIRDNPELPGSKAGILHGCTAACPLQEHQKYRCLVEEAEFDEECEEIERAFAAIDDSSSSSSSSSSAPKKSKKEKKDKKSKKEKKNKKEKKEKKDKPPKA